MQINCLSTRRECSSGDHTGCAETDGEGACCAHCEVTVKVSGNTENVGDKFLRCYDYDLILQAFDNTDILEDKASLGGNGNTYKLVCTDAPEDGSIMSAPPQPIQRGKRLTTKSFRAVI